jgi:hypothetical protein
LTHDIEVVKTKSINNKMDRALLVTIIMRIALECRDSYGDIPPEVIEDLVKRLKE